MQLRTNVDAEKQALCKSYHENSYSSYPLAIELESLETSSLLDRAQNKPDVEGALRQLKKRRLDEWRNTIFIPPQAKASLQAPDDVHFPLMESVKEFLESERHQVFLLLGDSGSGKSTFNKALECALWDAYKKGDGTIPLYISLPTIDKPDQDMVNKHLRRLDFTDAQIRELKDHRKHILICDGYDESQQTKNLYTANQLNQPDEWQAKMVISCRSEYIGTDYRDRFQPGDRNQLSKTAQFREAVFVPFSTTQVDDYIDQYASLLQPLWRAEEYKQALNGIPSLKELVRNPFLMTLSLEVLPRMMDPGEQLSVARVTRVLLYDQFIEQWLERGKRRLGEKELSDTAKAALDSLSDEGFTINGIDFLKKLSVAIYKEQGGQPIVDYSRFQDERSWKSAFFSREDDTYLLREACPLTRNGNQYRFIHRSMLEYGLALAVFDPQEWRERKALQPSPNRRGSMSSVWSFEICDDLEMITPDNHQEPDIGSPLAWRSCVNEPSLLQFLEERAQQEPVFKQQLLGYIEYSKRDKKWRTAAANAITILIRAGVEFRFADLQGIQIPGADIGYGVFESSNLQGADLRKANLRNAWLRGTDLTKSQMTGAQFGELPLLKYETKISSSSCVYSPDGKSFTLGLSDGTIHVYATSNWDESWTLKGHSEKVVSIAYSPTGDCIASGGLDSRVRLWDITTGQCRHVFAGHTQEVRSVAYSPHGDSIVSGSYDNTVRVWDVETGGCRHLLSGHTARVRVVGYSSKGHTIASCSDDQTVRLWDASTGMCHITLSDHTQFVTSIAFSPQGDVIASASWDNTARIWEAETGHCRHILTEHEAKVEFVVFSPKGNQLASGGWEGKVRLWDVEAGTCLRILDNRRVAYHIAYSPQGDEVAVHGGNHGAQLWDVETGECRQTLTGHVQGVDRVLYPPKGGHIASASQDGTVRIWSVGAGGSRVVAGGHIGMVVSVKYSSKRRQVASCGGNGTIQLWDAGTGAVIHTLVCHPGIILDVVYSPQEDQLISCSKGGTVQVWDVESGTCIHMFSDQSQMIHNIDISVLGDRVALACGNMTVQLWNVDAGTCQHLLTGHSSVTFGVMFSPQGDQVASGSWDNTVRLWNVGTGACQHVLAGHTDRITCVVYSPNGAYIASGSNDRTVRLWSAETGACHHVLVHSAIASIFGPSAIISRMVFSPQGNQLASGDETGIVKVWDVETGDCQHTLTGHKKIVDALAFSPNGSLILSSSDDGEARLWGGKTGECHWTTNYDVPRSENGLRKVSSVAWITLNAGSFVTGGQDGSVRMWEVKEEGGHTRVRLRWRSITGHLTMEDACMQDVGGLSQVNIRLMKQRGAVGEPAVRPRESEKREAAIGSVVSKPKSSFAGKGQDLS